MSAPFLHRTDKKILVFEVLADLTTQTQGLCVVVYMILSKTGDEVTAMIIILFINFRQHDTRIPPPTFKTVYENNSQVGTGLTLQL